MKESSYKLVMNALFRGPRMSRPPVANPTSIACGELMDRAGVGFPQAHLDPQAMADLAQAGYEIVGFDAVMPEFSVDQEAAALGCRIDWGDSSTMPTALDTPYQDFGEVMIPEDFLERPSIKVVLDAISILRRNLGGQAAIIGKVMGPWTISYHLVGTENFLLAVGLGKEMEVRRMLNQLLPVTIAHCKAQFQAGADMVVLADHATRNLVGPHHYEQYLLPLHRIIADEVGGPLILHVCGKCDDRLELFADSELHGYHFEYSVGPTEAVRRIGDRMTLFGAVNNADTLLQGTPEEVYRQARECIAAGVHLICPECAIPLETPLANLKAIVQAAVEGF